jgi:hypothetical protein
MNGGVKYWHDLLQGIESKTARKTGIRKKANANCVTHASESAQIRNKKQEKERVGSRDVPPQE